MPKGKSDQKSSRGVPRKASSSQRSVKRSRNAAKQPERKLRHMLKRNGLRFAFKWANAQDGTLALSLLRKLRPEYQAQLAGEGTQ